MPSLKTNVIILVAIALILDLSLVALMVLDLQPKLTSSVNLQPNVEISIYGGEINVDGSLRYAFGLSPDKLTAPGPTLNFTRGDIVKFMFENVGNLPHTFAVVPKVDSLNPNPIQDTGLVNSGDTSSITVQFNQFGNLNYQCTVPGHADLGMWGNITINE